MGTKLRFVAYERVGRLEVGSWKVGSFSLPTLLTFFFTLFSPQTIDSVTHTEAQGTVL